MPHPAHSNPSCQAVKMSSVKLVFLILIVVTLVLLVAARPRSRSPIYNEVTSLPVERERLSNELLAEQISPWRRQTKKDFYLKRHSFINPKMMLSRSPFLQSFYDVPEPDIAPGGANYFGNEVLPLSTYEIMEPESML
ncbi:uncharacterized protein LOC117582003 [Drosophila guanche]|uniref:Uncharacterized protein n=1 Tax=Drosophila guanche TaxID=7266 RepID=A0A3B0JGR9_DROGU|nr:uncharacterized protein LOC117582003 [Drosophila guanche]SPP79462.1 Hypothetical predicted protein [Drosophila guanche]